MKSEKDAMQKERKDRREKGVGDQAWNEGRRKE